MGTQRSELKQVEYGMHRHVLANYKFRNSGHLSRPPRPLRALGSNRQLLPRAFALRYDFVATEGRIRSRKAVLDYRLVHLEVLRLAQVAATTSPTSGVTPYVLTVCS